MSKTVYILRKDIVSMDLTAKAGEIGIQNPSGSDKYDEANKVWFDNGRYFFYLSKIKQFSDWFTEQEQNDWQIIEAKDKTGFIHPYLEKSCGLQPSCSIHSVKRLSDGEVFTIGKVYSYGKEGVLTTFSISAIGEMLCDIDYGNGTSYSNAPLRAIDVIKKEKGVFQWTDSSVIEFAKQFNTRKDIRMPEELLPQFKQSKSTPKEDKIIPVTIDEEAFKNRCTCCGDNLVYIRGKYPNEAERQTCPTCTTERLEQINEISNKDYGKTYKNN